MSIKQKNSQSESNSSPFSRQVAMFGCEGQEKLEGIIAVVAGLGGTGSHAIQQLAHLGIKEIIGIDPDYVELTNLNRLIGATHADAEVGVAKIKVMDRLVKGISPETESTIVRASVLETIEELKRADVIFGCIDNDLGRGFMNEIAVSYLIPMIDIGFVIEAKEGKIKSAAGQIRMITPSSPCLYCLGLNLDEIRRESLNKEELEMEQRLGYVQGADVPAPSVVSMNGVLASLAITEFLNLLFGFRELNAYIYYDMLAQRVIAKRIQTAKNEDCIVCSQIAGKGDLNDISSWKTQPSSGMEIPDRRGMKA